MTDVFRKYPFSSIVGIFAGTILLVLGFSYLFGIWLINNATCPLYPNDPCDAAPMLVMGIWMLSIPVSIGAAFISFVIYYLYIKE